MNRPPPEIERLVRAHRIVHRPDPDLRVRVRAAVDRDHRRRLAARWIGGTLVGGALGLAAILILRCASMTPSSTAAARLEPDPHGAAYDRERAGDGGVVSVPAPAPSPHAEATAEPETTPTESLPRLEAPPSTTRRAVPSPAAPGPRATSSERASEAEREVGLLREAELSLRSDPETALDKLGLHHREFPGTSLDVEREALTVLALCGAGRRIEGRGRRATFLKAHPASAYAARVRAACVDE